MRGYVIFITHIAPANVRMAPFAEDVADGMPSRTHLAVFLLPRVDIHPKNQLLNTARRRRN